MTPLILDNRITSFLNGEMNNTLKASNFILNQTYNATFVLLDYYNIIIQCAKQIDTPNEKLIYLTINLVLTTWLMLAMKQ